MSSLPRILMAGSIFAIVIYSFDDNNSEGSANSGGSSKVHRRRTQNDAGGTQSDIEETEDSYVDDWFTNKSLFSPCGDPTLAVDYDASRGLPADTEISQTPGCEEDYRQFDFLETNEFTMEDDIKNDHDFVEVVDELTLSLWEGGEIDPPIETGFFDGFKVTDSKNSDREDEEAKEIKKTIESKFSGEGNINHVISGRIVGGTIASERRYPYLVSLLNLRATSAGDKVYHACGGSLITPDVVLSAAHCVSSSLRYAQIGKYHMHTNRNRPNTVETMFIDKFVMHPGWSKRTFSNDLVLLKLSSKTERVNKLVRIQVESGMTDQEELQVMGWGKTSVSSRLSSYIRHVTVKYMTNAVCSSNRYGYGSVIKDMMFCANNGAADACQGDSGGPIVRSDQNSPDDPNRDIQVGVVSWGFGCSFARYPGVYARLDVDWIQRTVCDPYTGLSPESCASPSKLYATSNFLDPSSDDEESEIYKTTENLPDPERCEDKTTPFSSTGQSSITCETVKKFDWMLCVRYGDNCPKSCCPDSCDDTTGKCTEGSTVLRSSHRGRIREHRGHIND